MAAPPAKQPSLSPDLYTEEYFRGACEGFHEFNETHGEHLSRRLQASVTLAEISSGMRVLDVGCGRGEILRHCTRLGAHACGVDYAPAAVSIASKGTGENALIANPISQADAKALPFPDGDFDRVLLFDVVEHLFPWEMQQVLKQARRVMKPDGMLVVHTAPNAWYDHYAYPFVRLFRVLCGQGAAYPANPRALNVAANVDVHVNEQSAFSLWLALRRAGFRGRVWLQSPPQNRREPTLLASLRRILFGWPPFRWFFQREVFAVAWKAT
ncbi:MAG: class I SAM-dependent methyltransferase [Anaerolineales bacterium]|nr:class I SAM-dependent methyltransferase [Anaerolineales bacterium]